MKSAIYFFRALFIVVLALPINLVAQTNGKSIPKSLPFAAGETLTYEGKISKYISGISVAELKFTVEDGMGTDDLKLRADAKSKGTLLKLFRFSFVQHLDSTIDEDRFRILKTVKLDVQKDRVRNSEAVFDYSEKRVIYVESDPKEPMKPPRKIASGIEEQTHDLISGLYSLRLLPLAVGKIFELNVSDSGLVYQIPVKVVSREQQKTIFGRVWCFRVEPEVFGPGRLIEKEGRMVIWIADDARRIPVRASITIDFGKIDVKLKTAENLK